MATPAQRLESDRHKYPGMSPREVLIYRAWLRLHQSEYERFDYNVLVGNGTDPGPAFPQMYRDQYIRNTQKRMDIVAWQRMGVLIPQKPIQQMTIQEYAEGGSQPFILEVKDRATASCMSQLLTYKALWPITFPNTPPPVLVLITNRVTADMPLVLTASNIRLDLVPDVDFSILSVKAAVPTPPARG